MTKEHGQAGPYVVVESSGTAKELAVSVYARGGKRLETYFIGHQNWQEQLRSLNYLFRSLAR